MWLKSTTFQTTPTPSPSLGFCHDPKHHLSGLHICKVTGRETSVDLNHLTRLSADILSNSDNMKASRCTKNHKFLQHAFLVGFSTLKRKQLTVLQVGRITQSSWLKKSYLLCSCIGYHHNRQCQFTVNQACNLKHSLPLSCSQASHNWYEQSKVPRIPNHEKSNYLIKLSCQKRASENQKQCFQTKKKEKQPNQCRKHRLKTYTWMRKKEHR